MNIEIDSAKETDTNSTASSSFRNQNQNDQSYQDLDKPPYKGYGFSQV